MMRSNWDQCLTETEDDRRLMEQERILIEVAETIDKLMEASGLNKSDLARALNTNRSFVTKILRGSHNFTLRTLSDVLFALGRSAHFEVCPIGEIARVPAADLTELLAPKTGKKLDVTKAWPKADAPVGGGKRYGIDLRGLAA